MTASFAQGSTIKDINGNEIEIYGPHAYAVKEIKDGVVTLVNPWDSSKEIKIDRETLKSLHPQLASIDMSDNNPVKIISLIPGNTMKTTTEFSDMTVPTEKTIWMKI